MKLIVGLGNPGTDYAGTRHNVGFELIDLLARRHGIKVDQRGCQAKYGRGTIAEQPVLLARPTTFMNLSGDSVAAFVAREKLALTDLLILCDDIHLPVGRIRLRPRGSSGGQNGLKSVAARLGSQEWARLRIGVGEPPPGLQIDWVLSRFGAADRKVIDETLISAMDAVETWLTVDMEAAMCKVNATGQG
jgi:PTH1 family peptidyl-tRNA hydrolase